MEGSRGGAVRGGGRYIYPRLWGRVKRSGTRPPAVTLQRCRAAESLMKNFSLAERILLMKFRFCNIR